MSAAAITAEVETELAALARRLGAPLVEDAVIGGGFADPIRRAGRLGEVCMVVRRPGGRLLLSIKTFYPRGAYRLPTGGIGRGEAVLGALLRETREETGLDVAVRRFLARISYRRRDAPAPTFHTFAFLLDELGGTLGALDARERIEAYREIDPSELPAVADRLAAVRGDSGEIGGSWADWGEFRAVVHRVVHRALT
ncbi:MAG: NUDIX hydrolase [Candidatus Limnocylindria bacterium]